MQSLLVIVTCAKSVPTIVGLYLTVKVIDPPGAILVGNGTPVPDKVNRGLSNVMEATFRFIAVCAFELLITNVFVAVELVAISVGGLNNRG